MVVRSDDIKRLLAEKHASDLFVVECKVGATYTGTGMAMDAWAMRRTWSPPSTIGYEIKVSRGDFLADNKWPEYLAGCHQFYFVCPREVIKPEEVPEQCGLMYVAKTGTRLYTKKKAPWRDIGWPGDLMAYVLMSRAKITAYRAKARESTYWENWLKERETNRTLGYAVRGRIAEIAKEIEAKNQELVSKMEAYDTIRERIKELGFDPDRTIHEWPVVDKLKTLSGEIPPWVSRELRRASNEIDRIAGLVDEIVEMSK